MRRGSGWLVESQRHASWMTHASADGSWQVACRVGSWRSSRYGRQMAMRLLAPRRSTALAPMLLLTLGRGMSGIGRAQARNGGDDPRVDAAKAGFVSLVSHALRTPLNTLTGFVEIVLDHPVGPLNERQREFLEYARESGRALTQLVEDVTLLSRADEGTLALRYERLGAAEIAQRALRAVDATAEVKSIQLDLHVEGESLTLEGDGEWLAHALAKLLENAVKFSPENSEVILSATASDGAVHFVVRDQGPGVAPEDAERIFTRFYQAERTAKTHPGGYGLGLAVAQVIAQAHGGEILCRERAGAGRDVYVLVFRSAQWR